MKAARLLPALWCWSLVACAHQESSTIQAHQGAIPALTPAPAVRPQVPTTPLAKVEAASIYDLALPLVDETGAARSIDTFRGHPVLITMFYGSCPVACPILTSDLKRIERQLPESTRADVRILMVSFDPDRDTPQVLSRLKRERELDGARWTLASAGSDEARELAGVLNIKYRKLDNGAFFHSSVIVLLDRQGRPQARIDGASNDAATLLSALAAPSI
jgi:protein SCO1